MGCSTQSRIISLKYQYRGVALWGVFEPSRRLACRLVCDAVLPHRDRPSRSHPKLIVETFAKAAAKNPSLCCAARGGRRPFIIRVAGQERPTDDPASDTSEILRTLISRRRGAP